MTAISSGFTNPASKNRLASTAATAAAHTTAQSGEECPFVSIYVSTILAMSMLFLFGVAIPTAMVYGSAAGWGLGAFCAFWGGPSFGVMAASARVSGWYEKYDKEF